MPLLVLAALTNVLLTLQLTELLEANKPSPPREPYTPPFSGGQCGVDYVINYSLLNGSGGVVFSNSTTRRGGIGGSEIRSGYGEGGTHCAVGFSFNNGTQFEPISISPALCGSGYSIRFNSITRADNQPDNCGDIPNPNPPIGTIPDNGYGIPPTNIPAPPALLLVPSLPTGGALAAAAAAIAAAANALNAALVLLRAAASIADLADRIADVIGKLGDWLDKKRKEEEEKEKEKKKEEEKQKKKKIWSQNLGTIRKDGILSLVPNNANETVSLISLEVNFVNIPSSIGCYFGSNSPNRYPYDHGLGYLSFVGASGGVIETHKLEFRRNSLTIPSRTIGCNYHLGLNTFTSANVLLVYESE